MTIIFIFLVYPIIVNKTLEMLNCIKVEDEYRLKLELDIVCWEKDHILSLITVVLPITIVWIIGFPVFIFLTLKSNKILLDQNDMLIKYGLFYIGLTDEGYYWEIVVINLRKVLFIVVTVSLTRASR